MIFHPKNKQSIIDVVLQHQGTIDNLFSVMKENGYKIMNPNMDNGVSIVPNDRSRAVQFFRQNGTIPSNIPVLTDSDFDPNDFNVNNGDFS